jgi:hypothetical protein
MSDKQRKTRSDKKIRINASFTKSEHDRIDKLAVACGTNKTALLTVLANLCMSNENIIKWVLAQYDKTKRYRVVPFKDINGFNFMLVEEGAEEALKNDLREEIRTEVLRTMQYNQNLNKSGSLKIQGKQKTGE